MRRPLLILSLVLALGALAGQDVTRTMAAALLVLAGSLLVLAVAAPVWPAATAILGAGLAIGAAAAGVERATFDANPLLAWLQAKAGEGPEPVCLRGVAAADLREIDDRWGLVLDVDHLRAGAEELALGGRVRIQGAGMAPVPEILEGDRLAIWGHLRSPRSFGTPGSFDFAEQARREGVHAVAFCKSAQLIALERRRELPLGRDVAARARGWARRTLQRLLLRGPEEQLVRAMVLGDRTAVAPETAEAFRIAGTYHVLAISGAQVALLAGLLLFALRRLVASPGLTALAVSGGLAFYAQFVGGDVPVVRAVLMAAAMSLGRWLDLDGDTANLLGLAGFLILLDRPSAIADIGFQLSFGVTLGIVLLTPAFLPWFRPLPFQGHLALAGSVAAQAAVLPLLAIHFHRLAPAAILLNLAAVPLSGAVLLSGFGVLLSAATPFADTAADLAWIFAHALLRSGEIVRLLPALDARVASPSFGALALYLAGLLCLPEAKRRGQALGLMTVGVLCFALGPGPPAADGRLHVAVLDVGQGDGLVVTSPAGRTMLVDTGGTADGRFDLGEAVVGPYLWSAGVRRLDGLFVTHAHPDHVAAAPFVVRSFRVGEVWEGPAPANDPVYRAFDAALRAAHVARRTVTRGVQWEWDGVAIEILAPAMNGPPPWTTRNDDSLVISLRFGGVRLLLTGDIEARAEEALGATPSAVLKVPHHGSRTSSTPLFVRRTAPGVAVVSAGFRNRFGHPHAEVVERYLRQGTRLFRTDRDGTVTVSTDGVRIWVRTYDDPRERLFR